MRMTWCAGASVPILLTIPALLFSQPAPWPMRGRDARHTGRSIEVGPAAPALLWSYIVGSVGRKENASPPTVGSDGAVHIFSWNNMLYCIRPDGPLAWSYRMPAAGYPGAPALGADGRVFTGTSDYRIYSLTPAGSLSWSYRVGNVVISSPTIGSDGRIYATSWDDRLYCLESSGSLAWYYPIPYISFTSPAIDSRGNVYACSAVYGERIYALDSGGAFLWSYRMLYGSDSSPSIGPEGELYLGSWDNLLYAFDSDGALAWSYFTGLVFTSSPATDSDGTIFAGGADDRLYGLFPDGTLLWSYQAGGSSPAIDQAGFVYSGSTDNCLYGLTPGGSLAWSYRTGGSISHSAPALGTAGKLFVSSGDQRLYAFAWPPVPSPTATRTPTSAPTRTPTPATTGTPTPPPTATPDSGVVLVPSGAVFGPGDPLTLGIRVSISIWARFDAYLFAVTPVGTWTILLDGGIRPGIHPVARNVRRLDAPFRMTVLDRFPLPGAIAGQTTLYLVTVEAWRMPPVSDPSELTMDTPYVITVDRRTIEVR